MYARIGRRAYHPEASGGETTESDIIGAMTTELVTLDDVDRMVLRELRRDPRASFAQIGVAAGVSDRTVARRYARLRETGAIAVVGIVDPSRLGGAEQVVRMQCRPGSAAAVAEALARRDDTR